MKIKLVARENPLNRSEPPKLYANAVNIGTKDLKSIAQKIAGRSSLTRGDIENVICNFMDELPALLKDGFSVQIGEFGTMHLALSSEGAYTSETFNINSITNKVIFTPGVSFKKEIADISYVKE